MVAKFIIKGHPRSGLGRQKKNHLLTNLFTNQLKNRVNYGY